MWIELLICIVVLLWFFHYQRIKKLPDGPFSIPIFGTSELLTNRSRSLIGLFFQEKFLCYKDFCTFYVGTSGVVVLVNDFKLVKELFAMDEFSGRQLRIMYFDFDKIKLFSNSNSSPQEELNHGGIKTSEVTMVVIEE